MTDQSPAQAAPAMEEWLKKAEWLTARLVSASREAASSAAAGVFSHEYCEQRRTESNEAVAALLAHLRTVPAAQVAQPDPKLTITLRQAEKLLAFFGGHDCEVTIAREHPESNLPGLYAWCTEYPEEGSEYLGPTEVDDDLAANGRPVSAAQADQLDAARYRWLRGRVAGESTKYGQLFVISEPRPVGNIMKGCVAQHFDAAIDAAMKAQS
jgi:hypothetical protein